MDREETYDVVIVGGGHNGITAAAYLAKCGLSVCLLEERPEIGGGQENTEVAPGVLVDPHATLLYGAAAPGFEQLELWKYGFRVDWRAISIRALVFSGDRPVTPQERMVWPSAPTRDGVVWASRKDMEGWATLMGGNTRYPFLKDLLRAIYWCPPHPAGVEVTAQNIPYMQVLREKAPEVYSESLLEMNMFDMLDRFMESEAMKVFYCSISWFSGAAPHWEGMAIPSFGGAALMYYGSLAIPHNGMHHYAHAIVRCALAHGARVFTCCPVDEIIVENGVAVGVRLRETAVRAEKTIRARKAVISAVPVQKTFLDLISPRHTDIAFRQRVKDISLKGGSLYVAHILMRGMPTYTPRFAKDKGTDLPAFVGHYPCDSRELFLGHVADIDARKTTPTLDLDKMFVGGGIGHNHLEEPGRVPADHWLFTPVYMQVPAPEYHVAGPEAVNEMKADVNAAILRAYSEVIANVNADTLAGYWANSPYDSELRNTGMIAGNWYATAHSLDQWAERRPLPELARYRTPIDGLYLCHQTSHPGGLCLMAVPYNLMHILIEDGIAQPGAWWYPSPHYIAEQRAPRATVSI